MSCPLCCVTQPRLLIQFDDLGCKITNVRAQDISRNYIAGSLYLGRRIAKLFGSCAAPQTGIRITVAHVPPAMMNNHFMILLRTVSLYTLTNLTKVLMLS